MSAPVAADMWAGPDLGTQRVRALAAAADGTVAGEGLTSAEMTGPLPQAVNGLA